MKCIEKNPYRVLGVYANAPKKDIVANKGKATAFLKVGKSVEYPLDLNAYLPKIERIVSIMDEADAHLTLANEKIKFAQFWFLDSSQLDKIAFNHLMIGNIDEAVSIWSKQDNLSSLQNRIVCYLIKGNLQHAVYLAERLYEQYGTEYVHTVDTNCTLQKTGTELFHQFIDTLSEEVNLYTLLQGSFKDETLAYIKSCTLDPLISKISSEVEKAKRVDHKDAQARLEAAEQLVTNTKEALSLLKSILPATESQYQMIADKLGSEILQCGIDFFNNSTDENRYQKAMWIQKYAQSVVVGSLAKKRCDENVKILQNIIDKLPPREVRYEDEVIKVELSKYENQSESIQHAIYLLNNTKPYLQSIKRKLGNNIIITLKSQR